MGIRGLVDSGVCERSRSRREVEVEVEVEFHGPNLGTSAVVVVLVVDVQCCMCGTSRMVSGVGCEFVHCTAL